MFAGSVVLGDPLYLPSPAVARVSALWLNYCTVQLRCIHAGLERARAQGKVLGRPKVSPRTEALIRQKRARGMGILKIAREVGVGTSVVQRVLSSG